MSGDKNQSDFDARRALRETYARAARQREAQSFDKPHDWQHLQRIEKLAEDKRNRLNDDFVETFDARIAIARQTIIDKNGRQSLDHLTPDGRDRFNSDRINQEADRQVRLHHQGTLDAVDDAEFDAREILQKTAQRRGELRGKLTDSFSRSVDKSRGPERSGPAR
ncbi:MAG: hypothetical protein AAFQ10_00130 [Pseudomonadota bacterium]